MKPVRFGFTLPTYDVKKQHRPTYVRDVTRALDLVAGSFDSIWAIDHLQFEDLGMLEAFATLTYFAALHPEYRFGHAVLCQSFRNPALLAKMAATLQFLSGGRFILGIGAGWHKEEYYAYGYDFPPRPARVAQLDETLQIIARMWTEEKVTFEGKHYRVTDAYCEPKPDPVPTLMVGAFGPKMLRLSAKHADWWNASSTGPREYRRLSDELDRACTEIDRDPATLRRTWCGGCACARTRHEAEVFAAGRCSPDDEDDFGFAGTPEEVSAQMRAFIDMGVDYFMLDCLGFPNLTTLELLAGEVLPFLNSRGSVLGFACGGR
jgi:alkanesulfonate monooxygenase SsuD/methylene tetrahydromethanopterin reductase-like flavin-dependent oxidoreductase (luciferase family)